MRWLKAFGWLPTPVFYVDEFWGRWKGFGGLTILNLIFIKRKYEGDGGLHAHEVTHVEQAYRLLFLLHSVLYLLSRKYRLWAEVQAYRRQIAFYGQPASIDFAVDALVSKYDLNITVEEARSLLLNKE